MTPISFAVSTYWIAGVMLGIEMQKTEDGDKVLVIDLFILRVMVFFGGVDDDVQPKD